PIVHTSCRQGPILPHQGRLFESNSRPAPAGKAASMEAASRGFTMKAAPQGKELQIEAVGMETPQAFRRYRRDDQFLPSRGLPPSPFALGRPPMRPAHIHFIVGAPGFEPVTTHMFVAGDEYLDSDAVFGVKDSLIVHFVRHDDPGEAKRLELGNPYYTAEH